MKPLMTLAVTALAALSSVSPLASGPAQDETTLAVRAVLDKQVADWNKGDLVGFMKGYWESDDLTFYSGNNVTTGWKATLERYRKKYQQDGKEMGKLSFEELSFLSMGPDHSLVRGRYRLQLRNETPTGIFTVILRRTAAGWRIVHDHTSS
jgi:beta-aspartyl-peptidase (threonine type)